MPYDRGYRSYGRRLSNPRRASRPRKPDVRIEFPAQGETYCEEKFGVYEYSRYERSSVLAGQQRRVNLGSYDTEAEARAAHPEAAPGISGCGYQKPYLLHLPEYGDVDVDW